MTTLNLIEMTRLSDNYVCALVVLVLFAITFSIIGFRLRSTIHFKSSGYILLGFCVLCILVFVCLVECSGNDAFQEPSGKYQIEATFSEDMPFLSVMEEYDIVEQRGDIFVLEPKERTVD